MIGKILTATLALGLFAGSAFSAEPEHWALGEWSRKLGTADYFVEVCEVRADGSVVGGAFNASPVMVDSKQSFMRIENDAIVMTFTSGAVMRLARSKAPNQLTGSYTSKDRSAIDISAERNPESQLYFGDVHLRGCVGLSKSATVIIHGNTVRGNMYTYGYVPAYFKGAISDGTFKMKSSVKDVGNFDFYGKQKGDVITLEVGLPSDEAGRGFICHAVGDLKRLKI